MTEGLTVSERLVGFMRHWQMAGLPREVTHEANRLLLNQLKASVGGAAHPAVKILHDWASASPGPAEEAHVIWLGGRLPAEHACMINAALFEVLDFNETYIPTFQHAVSGVLPSVLATAETNGSSGAQVLEALALGIEVELACARILMPTGYFRGFIPGGITGAIGGAAACAILDRLDDIQTRNALGLAMNSGMGFYQSAGSMALPYVMAQTARNGLLASRLAARGMDAQAASFEGDKAMLSAYSDESPEKIGPVLDSLGKEWRIFGQSYKTFPTETITHAPVECVLQLLARAAGRKIAQLEFGVAELVVSIAEERAARFGAPSNDLEARFDMKHCAAAAWTFGRFTLAEMQAAAFTNPDVLSLRDRITLTADSRHPTFDGASLTATFEDGSAETVSIPDFRGTPGNPLSDAELSDLFRLSSEGVLSRARTEAILEETWNLPEAPGIQALMHQLVIDKD